MGRTTTLIANGKHKFNVDEKFTVRVWESAWDENTDGPWLLQPGAPGGADFASQEEAEKWANQFLTTMQTPVEEAPVEPTL